jgi:hypothetical protein
MATVDLTVAADLSSLRRQLAEIPGIGADAATKMAAELNKSIKASERASVAAAKASKAAADGAKAAGRAASEALDSAAESASRFGDKAGAVGSNAGKLAGILDMLVPGLGGVARGVADVADTAEVASVATKGLGVSMSSTLAVMGPVAVAVLALGATYSYLSSVLGEVEAKNAAAATAATTQAEATAQFAARKREVADAFVVANNATEAETIAIRKSNEATDQAAAAARSLAVARVAEAKAKRDSVGAGSDRSALNTAEAQLKALDAEIEATKTQSELVISAEFAAQRAAKETAAAQLAAAAAESGRAEAEAATAAELAAVEEAERRVLAQNAAYVTSIRSLEDVARSATEAQLTGAAAVEAALARQIEKANETAALQAERSMGSSEQLVAIEEARLAAVTALEAKGATDIDAIYQAASAKRDELREREAEAEEALRKRINASVLSSTSGMLGDLSGAFAAAAEEQGKTNKAAAMAMFVASKAAALAQAVVNTALAISSANTLPPPASFVAMAAAGLSGALSVGAIAASPPPSFNDTPGVQQMGQRGNVNLASGDFFAAARSPGDLQRQVGMMGAGAPSILQVRLGHKVLDQSVARTIQEGGRLSREISGRTKTGTTGHRGRA